jgi:hypothetical protein
MRTVAAHRQFGREGGLLELPERQRKVLDIAATP